jgi:hypothetical protein
MGGGLVFAGFGILYFFLFFVVIAFVVLVVFSLILAKC